MLVEPLEEWFIFDTCIFQYLAIASGDMALRQGCEGRAIADDSPRLIECANEIFAMTAVDGGFSANGAIDLRQERCRHMDKGEPSEQEICGDAAHIAYDAAA